MGRCDCCRDEPCPTRGKWRHCRFLSLLASHDSPGGLFCHSDGLILGHEARSALLARWAAFSVAAEDRGEKMQMLPLELALRSATVAVLLLTGVVILRDRRHRESGGLGGLLALSVAADCLVSIAGLHAFPWLWPLQLVAIGTPAMLWIWAGAVFDDYRPSWRAAAGLGDPARRLASRAPCLAALGRDSGKRPGPVVRPAGGVAHRGRPARRSGGAPPAPAPPAGGACRALCRRRRAHEHAGRRAACGCLQPDSSRQRYWRGSATAFALLTLRAGQALAGPPLAGASGPQPDEANRSVRHRRRAGRRRAGAAAPADGGGQGLSPGRFWHRAHWSPP